MPKCDFCESGIFFRGVRDRGEVYCDANCQQRGRLLKRIENLPQSIFDRVLEAIQKQECGKCEGPGPINVHTHYTVFSVLVFAIHNSHQQVCCGKCAINSKLNGILLSGLLGWWSIPWGLIWTPIQIGRNVSGLLDHAKKTAEPSSELLHLAHLLMVEKMIESGTEFPEPEKEIEYAEEDD